MTEYDDLLREAYLGEMFGDTFFATMAERQPDKARREKLETLQIVEARTAQSLRRLIDRKGLSDAELDAREKGRELAEAIDPEDWDNFVSGLLGALPKFLADFERLRDIAKQPTDPALIALVNHEQAIEHFARLEVEGEEDKSLLPLQAHLRKPA
ncbi:MAG TPA: hypothetical protein VFX21_16415 [Acidimicrobiia bacterium]|nr:hypothetical protein [Acidimicrobiia bacterium]